MEAKSASWGSGGCRHDVWGWRCKAGSQSSGFQVLLLKSTKIATRLWAGRFMLCHWGRVGNQHTGFEDNSWTVLQIFTRLKVCISDSFGGYRSRSRLDIYHLHVIWNGRTQSGQGREVPDSFKPLSWCWASYLTDHHCNAVGMIVDLNERPSTPRVKRRIRWENSLSRTCLSKPVCR